MKHIKQYERYEQYENNLKWFYVICYENEKELNDFLSVNIGQIINDDYTDHRYPLVVHYDLSTATKDVKEWFTIIEDENDANSDYFEYVSDFDIVGKGGVREFSPDEILHHSKNKEDLEIYINANKYNL